ncbi:major histocompatibility complex class I-related gene protein-like [Trachinotus anak]|uniref:major histocompatibility complex class I-related gene protein-like n=1 Tax=Trachinotus anak TaxID=443729 RepID=UPI0039F1E360
MVKFVLLFMLLFCHDTSAVKHSLSFFLTGSSGVLNFPEFVAVVLIDEVQAGYCDSDIRKAKATLDWVEECTADDPKHMEFFSRKCFTHQQFFKITMDSLKQRLNQSEGVHIFQRVHGCEWDDETGEIQGFNHYGYDGEDFLALNLNTLTWTAPKPQAFFPKLRWGAEKVRLQYNKHHLIQECPSWLKKYVGCGRALLQRTEFPSVSLLQKTPSSPVSCHATGFYPDRVTMSWRKDGAALHETEDHGVILPNHDGTYQMSVDLDVSSVLSEEWGKYSCVFQFPGIKEVIVTKLDPAVIKTNQGETMTNIYKGPMDVPTGPVIGGTVLLLLIAIIAGVLISREKNGERQVENCEDNEAKMWRFS